MSEKKKYFYRRRKRFFIKQKSESNLSKTEEKFKSDDKIVKQSEKIAKAFENKDAQFSPREKKGNTQHSEIKKQSQNAFLGEEIINLTKDLIYISETDSEIDIFEGGAAQNVSAENLKRLLPETADKKITEENFEDFFTNLTKIEDWFGDGEKQFAEKFAKLKQFLEENLKDLKVFKIGKTQIDIYVAGLNKDGILCGIKTKAVET